MSEVEIVVAVHDPARPIERAVASVLACPEAGAIVVVHNTDPGRVRERLQGWEADPRLRILELHDGVHSPAGPFNAGLDAVRGPFAGVLGSDDELAPGAVRGWLRLQRRRDADVVIARLAIAGAHGDVPTPPVRVPSRRYVDGVRDRLCYRSAPLGMYRRELFPTLRFTPGVATGEDIAVTTELWFTPCRRVFDANGAPYIIHSDGGRRVTSTTRAVADDLAFLPSLCDRVRWLGLNTAQRRALVVKLVRVQLFGVLLNRRPDWWTSSERADLARLTRAVVAMAPEAPAALSRAEWRLLQAMGWPGSPVPELYRLLRRRRRGPAGLIPHSPIELLRREAPLRFGAASLARASVRALRLGRSRPSSARRDIDGLR